MSMVFMHEIERLKKSILSLSAQVEESVVLAVKALISHDAELARRIIDGDADIDHQEVEVEEEALKILALYQPVAMDLRFLTTVLKINNDLERIGDLAANIAKRALSICEHPEVRIPAELDEIALKARDMVRNSLTAFVNLDAQLANEVRDADDEVDDLCKKVCELVVKCGQENPAQLGLYTTMLIAARNLERIGDHATNVAEDIVYLVEGVIVRHQPVDEEE